MRWPLKFQVMVPMATAMLAVVVALSLLHAYFAARQSEQQISSRLQDVTRTLESARYPLTDNVLTQMQGLSGADFVLVDKADRLVATSRRDIPLDDLLRQASRPSSTPLELATVVHLSNERFFHTVVALSAWGGIGGTLQLHVLYPEKDFLRQRRQAIVPPLVIGGAALAVACGLALLIASRVTRPLGQLREQVRRIAEGDFRTLELPGRNDEIRELALDIQQMAERLSQYEEQIRRAEQSRTLTQVGASLAHQLRNSATGARIALDLHSAECPLGSHDECLTVATRQMILMEKYLRRFLSRGTTAQGPHEILDFAQLVARVVELVQPAARHAAVRFDVDISAQPMPMSGDADSLEHMVLNLLMNAVDAAGASASLNKTRPAAVKLGVSPCSHSQVSLTVCDTGPGPDPRIAERLFEPFVTSKQEGAGLGLSVARHVVEAHHGSIQWQRRDNTTCFVVTMPLYNEGNTRGNVAGSR
jgi:signal transduction histidine kinase